MVAEPDFFVLVTDRPDPTLSLETLGCRHCNHPAPLVVISHEETLLGSLDGSDPNHHWLRLACPACGKETHFEHKRGNAWIVELRTARGAKLLRGVPNCYESYIYTCINCGGDVRRHYIDKRNEEPAKVLGWGPDGKSYRTAFSCDKCGLRSVCEDEYYRGPNT